MRALIITLPLGVVALLLLLIFAAVSFGAREVVRRRCSDEDREELADQAKNLLTGVAATFAFFVGFAITVTWGAVSAAQTAVEQQAAAVRQMAREVDNITDRARSVELMDQLRVYANAAAVDDADPLRRGTTTALPSATALDRLEDSVIAYAYGAGANEREAAGLSAAASTLSNSAFTVSAVASRAIPGPLVVLLLFVGALASIIMGITTVAYRRPLLIFVWCLIPAISITVVAGLAFPFAMRNGMTLAPMQAVAQLLGG